MDDSKQQLGKRKERRHKHQQLVHHLRILLTDPNQQTEACREVLDYLMRRLSAQKALARHQAVTVSSTDFYAFELPFMIYLIMCKKIVGAERSFSYERRGHLDQRWRVSIGWRKPGFSVQLVNQFVTNYPSFRSCTARDNCGPPRCFARRNQTTSRRRISEIPGDQRLRRAITGSSRSYFGKYIRIYIAIARTLYILAISNQDLAQVIVERSSLVASLLPSATNKTTQAAKTLEYFLQLFWHYLLKVRKKILQQIFYSP